MSTTTLTDIIAEIDEIIDAHGAIVIWAQDNGLGWRNADDTWSDPLGPEMPESDAQDMIRELARHYGVEVGPSYGLRLP